jgi:hypothetical protein
MTGPPAHERQHNEARWHRSVAYVVLPSCGIRLGSSPANDICRPRWGPANRRGRRGSPAETALRGEARPNGSRRRREPSSSSLCRRQAGLSSIRAGARSRSDASHPGQSFPPTASEATCAGGWERSRLCDRLDVGRRPSETSLCHSPSIEPGEERGVDRNRHGFGMSFATQP